MEDFPKLEAAYKAMSKKKRLRIIELAQLYAANWPTEAAEPAPVSLRKSHLRIAHSRDKR